MDRSEKIQIPIYEKANLTLDEAAVYFNIGKHKLRQLTNDPSCEYVLFVGEKRLIKRVPFEKYLNGLYSI